ERRYSGNPGTAFFTGGGQHYFQNFERADNERRPSVREGFQRSINLVFVRVMLDVVDHIMASQLESDAILAAPNDDSRRRAYLWLCAPAGGSVPLPQAHARFAPVAPADQTPRLYEGRKPSPKAAAAAIRAVDPSIDLAQFSAQLASVVPAAN